MSLSTDRLMKIKLIKARQHTEREREAEKYRSWVITGYLLG